MAGRIQSERSSRKSSQRSHEMSQRSDRSQASLQVSADFQSSLDELAERCRDLEVQVQRTTETQSQLQDFAERFEAFERQALLSEELQDRCRQLETQVQQTEENQRGLEDEIFERLQRLEKETERGLEDEIFERLQRLEKETERGLEDEIFDRLQRLEKARRPSDGGRPDLADLEMQVQELEKQVKGRRPSRDVADQLSDLESQVQELERHVLQGQQRRPSKDSAADQLADLASQVQQLEKHVLKAQRRPSNSDQLSDLASQVQQLEKLVQEGLKGPTSYAAPTEPSEARSSSAQDVPKPRIQILSPEEPQAKPAPEPTPTPTGDLWRLRPRPLSASSVMTSPVASEDSRELFHGEGAKAMQQVLRGLSHDSFQGRPRSNSESTGRKGSKDNLALSASKLLADAMLSFSGDLRQAATTLERKKSPKAPANTAKLRWRRTSQRQEWKRSRPVQQTPMAWLMLRLTLRRYHCRMLLPRRCRPKQQRASRTQLTCSHRWQQRQLQLTLRDLHLRRQPLRRSRNRLNRSERRRRQLRPWPVLQLRQRHHYHCPMWLPQPRRSWWRRPSQQR
ncbi:unnamed protein product [Effrenium voratum]|nr:unnamed protein product [Effrenium voratum]